MGRPATRQGRAAAARRPRGRPSFESSPRRGAGDGGDPTVREFLPWHVVEKKLAARASGVALLADDDDPPSSEDLPGSGVHPSVSERAANDALLTYKVYTLADLDALQAEDAPDAPPSSMRLSLSAYAATRGPSPWKKTASAALAVGVALFGWATMGRGRPSLADALRAPGVVFDVELRAALRGVDWKKVAIVAGSSVATICVALFAVLTVAELTDDYHAPGAAAMAHTAPPIPPAPFNAAIPATAAPAPAPVVAAQPPPAAPEPALEVDDDPPPPPVKTKRAARVKAAPAPKADVEVFIP